MDSILNLHALGPLLLRDGRPFAGGDEESRAQSLPLPLPSTLAGFVRTQVGEAAALNWRGPNDDALHRQLQDLHVIPVRSTLLRDDGLKQDFMFPAPLNAVIDEGKKIYRLSPEPLPLGEEDREGAGVNFPRSAAGLCPLSMSPTPDGHFKADSGYTYWPTEVMRQWLLNENPQTVERVSGPPIEERTHVAMDSQTGRGKEGKLYSVSYRSFEERQGGQHHTWSLRIKTDLKADIAPVGHLGGEWRTVGLENVGNSRTWPNIGEFGQVRAALLDPANTRLCFILTSPALFGNGWKPSWLDLDIQQAEQHNGDSLPAGVKALAGRVRLLGAAVGRRVPVSGWNLRIGKPKSVRWAVPAGSVYFLEVDSEFE